jgi:hypothetical protein
MCTLGADSIPQSPPREAAANRSNAGQCVGDSVAFRMSEDALARLEAGLRAQEKKPFPQGAQLPAALGLGLAENAGFPQKDANLSFKLSPPPAPERPRSAPLISQQRHHLGGLLYILIAGAILAPVAYYFSIGGSGQAPGLALTEPKLLEQPTPGQKREQIEAQANNETIGGANQGESKGAPPSPVQAPIAPTMPAMSAMVSPGIPSSGRLHRPRGARHPQTDNRSKRVTFSNSTSQGLLPIR